MNPNQVIRGAHQAYFRRPTYFCDSIHTTVVYPQRKEGLLAIKYCHDHRVSRIFFPRRRRGHRSRDPFLPYCRHVCLDSLLDLQALPILRNDCPAGRVCEHFNPPNRAATVAQDKKFMAHAIAIAVSHVGIVARHDIWLPILRTG